MKVKSTINLSSAPTSEYSLRCRSVHQPTEESGVEMQVETSSEAASVPSSASISPNDPIPALPNVSDQTGMEKAMEDAGQEEILQASNGDVEEKEAAVEDDMEEIDEEEEEGEGEEDEEDEEEEEEEGLDTPPPTMAAWHPAVDTSASVNLPPLSDDKQPPSSAEPQLQQAQQTQTINLNPVTWQLFQQERARVNPSMDDSMFVHWLLTNIRPSAYFQHLRSPNNATAATPSGMVHPTPATGVESGIQPASTPSSEGGNTASMMHLAAAAAAAASCGGVSSSPYPASTPSVVPSVATAAAMRGLYCTICRKHFSSRAGLIQHQRGMHAYQPHFRCNKCGQRFRWASQLHDHRRKGYCPGPLTSPQSQAAVSQPQRLPVMGGSDPMLRLPPISSVASSSNGTHPPISCNGGETGEEEGLALDDAEVSAMAQDMEELIEALAEDGGAGGGGISCPECSFTTSTRDNLEVHFKTAHVVEDLFSCTCGSDFACLSLFLCHYISCPIAATDLGQKAATAATAASQSAPPPPPPQPPQQQQQQQPQQAQQQQPQYPLPPPLGHHRMPPPPPHFFPLRPPPLGAGEHQFPSIPAPQVMPSTPPVAAVAAGRPRAPNGQANCQYCNQTFSNKNTLKQHIIGMHSHEAQYHCEHCGKPFRWAPSYYTHRRKCGLAARGLGPSPRGRGRGGPASMARYC